MPLPGFRGPSLAGVWAETLNFLFGTVVQNLYIPLTLIFGGVYCSGWVAEWTYALCVKLCVVVVLLCCYVVVLSCCCVVVLSCCCVVVLLCCCVVVLL